MGVIVVFFPGFVAGVIYILMALRLGRRDQPSATVCKQCGYDLSGLDLQAPCPECRWTRGSPLGRGATSAREVMATFAALLLLLAPFLLIPVLFALVNLVKSSTGYRGYEIVHIGWMFGSGPFILAHCQAIEMCVRWFHRGRPRTASSILWHAALIYVASGIATTISGVIVMFPFMPD